MKQIALIYKIGMVTGTVIMHVAPAAQPTTKLEIIELATLLETTTTTRNTIMAMETYISSRALISTR